MNASTKSAVIQSAIAAALASLANRASCESEEFEPKNYFAKAEKAVKPAKTAKARGFKKAKEDNSHKIPVSFPAALPLNVEEFLAKVNGKIETAPDIFRQPDTMELFSYCHGFVAWLKETNNARLNSLSPAMAPGALLDSCRRIISLMNNSSLLIEEDHSNRIGKVVVAGSAGTTHRFAKMVGSLRAMLIQAESDALKNKEEALIKAELARELFETDPADAFELEQESVVHAGMAAIEGERADQIRKVIEDNDLSRIEALYEQLGAKELKQEVLVGYDFGSFGKLEAPASE